MRTLPSPRILRAVLWADAASAAACGVLQVGAATTLARWFGLPSALLLATGGVLLVVAACAAWLAAAQPLRPRGVLLLVAVNVAWVLGCIDLLVTGVATTAAGTAWVVLQAIAVGILAELEWIGVRRAQAPALA